MTTRLFFFTLLYSMYLMAGAQTRSLQFRGRVLNAELSDKPVLAAYVHLKSDAGHMYESKTDSSGEYCFDFPTINFTRLEMTVASDRFTVNAGEKPRNCGFLATREKFNYTVPDTLLSTIQVYDFRLTPTRCCELRFPSVWFKYGSGQIDSISYTQDRLPEDADLLTMLVSTMKDNPKITVELSGHCSADEKYADELSLLRAETIRLELMKHGIDGRRLVAKGYGNRKLLVSLAITQKAKTKEKREALHRKNRRCVFKIINWEFEP